MPLIEGALYGHLKGGTSFLDAYWQFRLPWSCSLGREVGGAMLTISGLRNFYYLPHFHDMRCKAPRISEIIRSRYHHDPHNGDVYIFMSKDQRKVKMIHYEHHAYYLHEKSFTDGYRFMRIELQDDVLVYKIEWRNLVAVLESPVVKSLRLS